eukprot:TRINITY_DN8810_c0_g1_i1.p1 TRINITY_DN8810_c0_g1~~TRINITY_DN8810_c0_g1_i1.p1  ORF type:complete len:359 (-),score=78.84 TRINITY_DN8810_c0_g1_i1:79-1155(-)
MAMAALPTDSTASTAASWSQLAASESSNHQQTQAQRQSIQRQQQLAEGLLRYSEAIGPAFVELAKVHEALAEAGVETDLGAGAFAAALHQGLQEGKRQVDDAVSSTRTALDTYVELLAACCHDLDLAEQAASGLEHYKTKLASIGEDKQRNGPPAASSKPLLPLWSKSTQLSRNRDKLRKAASKAGQATIRADDSVQACALRRSHLSSLAASLVQATAAALQHALNRVATSNADRGAAAPAADAVPTATVPPAPPPAQAAAPAGGAPQTAEEPATEQHLPHVGDAFRQGLAAEAEAARVDAAAASGSEGGDVQVAVEVTHLAHVETMQPLEVAQQEPALEGEAEPSRRSDWSCGWLRP